MKMGKIVIACSAVFLCLGGHLAGGTENAAEGYRFVKEAGGIREYELLSNGLRVLLAEEHSAPVAALMVTYPAGPRNETKGRTEAAHFLEHLMFKGTDRFNRRKGTAIPFLLEETGAMLNATTGLDGTHYYEVLPKEQLPLAMEIEADRMRNSLFRKEDVEDERRVILNEYEKYENFPLFALEEAVWRKAFKKHPYRYGMIGVRRDVEKMTAKYLRNFYDTYYWPDHAVLTLIGDFDEAGALALVREKFSGIRRSPKPVPGVEAQEPEQKKMRRVRIRREDEIEALMIAFKIPPALDPDLPALEVLSGILADGKTGRLYGRLVDSGLAVQVGAEAEKLRDPGLFVIQAILAPGKSPREIETPVLEVLEEIKEKGVTQEELERAKNQLRAQVSYSRDGCFSIAGSLGQAISQGDWALYPARLGKIRQVNIEDVKRVAVRYLDRRHMTVGELVTGKWKSPEIPAGSFPKAPEPESAEPEAFEEDRLEMLLPEKNDLEVGLRDRMSVTRVQGIKVISLRTGVENVVALAGSFRGGGHSYSKNPLLAGLVTEMLDKGTTKRDKIEIAKTLENEGIEIDFICNYERAGFRARALKEDVPLLLELLAEELRSPKFDLSEFEKVKKNIEAGIREKMSDPESLASGELSRRIYPPGHPNYEISPEEALALLQATTLDEVRAFYEGHYGNNQFIVAAAGDVEPSTIEEAVGRRFQGWPEKTVEKPYDGKVRINEASRTSIQVEGKKNIEVFFGHAMPLTRISEDFLPAYIANYAFGGNFSARLSRRLRDELGLTYGVYSKLAGVSEEVEGNWLIRMISQKGELDRGIREISGEAASFAGKGITAGELARKKRTVIGRFKVDLASARNIAEIVLRYEEWGLGTESLEKYSSEIEGLSISRVNSVIAKYFQPSKLHCIIAGDAEKEDKS